MVGQKIEGGNVWFLGENSLVVSSLTRQQLLSNKKPIVFESWNQEIRALMAIEDSGQFTHEKTKEKRTYFSIKLVNELMDISANGILHF